jgi:hypothetical protein
VEKGTPPASIIATRYPQDAPGQSLKMTRPLCPYPETAMWTGTGSTNDAANFTCKTRDVTRVSQAGKNAGDPARDRCTHRIA